MWEGNWYSTYCGHGEQLSRVAEFKECIPVIGPSERCDGGTWGTSAASNRYYRYYRYRCRPLPEPSSTIITHLNQSSSILTLVVVSGRVHTTICITKHHPLHPRILFLIESIKKNTVRRFTPFKSPRRNINQEKKKRGRGTIPSKMHR